MYGTDAAVSIALAGVALLSIPVIGVGAIALLAKLSRKVSRARHRPTDPTARHATVIDPNTKKTGVSDLLEPGYGEHSEVERLAIWRYRQLLDLDLDPVSAAEASLSGMEVSQIRSLIEHGCPPNLAIEILELDHARAQR